MALHLLKMCVGVDSVAMLRERQAARLARLRAAGESAALRHLTRNMPRRADEIAGNGSLYWIIRGHIAARQEIVALARLAPGDAGAPKRCAILLGREVVETELRPRRPMQGWRYLEARDAPPDRFRAPGGDAMPPAMAAELRELGLI